jgi:predicted PurR-regulated permease PerM
MVFIFIPMIARLATVIGENGTEWLNDLVAWISDTFGVELWNPQASEEASQAVSEWLRGWVDQIFGTVVGIVSAGIGFLFWMATVAMFTFYFTAQAPQLRNAVLSLFSPRVQERLGWTWDRAIKETGGYFYSRLILMLINGTGFFFTMVVVGVPAALSLGLAFIGAFIAAFIPAVGTYIGSAIPALVTLAIQGLVPALIVVAYAIVYQQIENYILSPKISANTMTLNGGLAFGAALFGGAVAGPLGAFMALPVTALVSAFIAEYGRRNVVVYESPHDSPRSAEAELPEP